MKQRIYINTFLIMLLSLLLALVFLITGCSSVKKTQSSHSEAKDSTGLKKKDSVAVASFDFTKKKIDSSQYHKTIIIEIDSNYSGSNSATEDDYDTVIHSPLTTHHPLIFDVWEPGPVKIDLGKYKPSRISITESGSRHSIDSSAIHSKDSSAIHSSDSTATKDIVKDSSSSKHKTGIPFLIGTGITIAGLLLLFFWIRRKTK